jgi:hypothetical protein
MVGFLENVKRKVNEMPPYPVCALPNPLNVYADEYPAWVYRHGFVH